MVHRLPGSERPRLPGGDVECLKEDTMEFDISDLGDAWDSQDRSLDMAQISVKCISSCVQQSSQGHVSDSVVISLI